MINKCDFLLTNKLRIPFSQNIVFNTQSGGDGVWALVVSLVWWKESTKNFNIDFLWGDMNTCKTQNDNNYRYNWNHCRTHAFMIILSHFINRGSVEFEYLVKRVYTWLHNIRNTIHINFQHLFILKNQPLFTDCVLKYIRYLHQRTFLSVYLFRIISRTTRLILKGLSLTEVEDIILRLKISW